jgi:hypothetical protein
VTKRMRSASEIQRSINIWLNEMKAGEAKFMPGTS